MTTEPLTAIDHPTDLAWPHIYGVLPVGILILDSTLRILYRNDAAAALVGSPRTFAELNRVICPADRQRLATGTVEKTVRSREMLYRDNIQCKSISADLRRTNWTLRPFQSGASQYTLAVIEDITATSMLQHRLDQSERHAAVGKLAAKVAHELNNPLDGILRYVNLAARMLGDGSDPKVLEYLIQCRTGLKRMARIIAELLEFSRSSEAMSEEMSINSIVEDAIQALREPAERNGVTISAVFRDEKMPVLPGGRLFQICCNLIRNAIDAMPDGGRLMISTAVLGSDVVLQFEDTGCGLPEDVNKVFEPFFTTKEPGKGTGLGLAICKEYIAGYGGSIEARPGKDRGAAFIVRFPLGGTVAAKTPVEKP